MSDMSCYRGAHRRLIGAVVIGSSTEEYLFHFAEVQSVLVMRPELHEAHIARLRQLRYAFYAWEKSIGTMRNNLVRNVIPSTCHFYYYAYSKCYHISIRI